MADSNISHSVIASEFNDSLVFCQQRIKDAGDKPHVTVEKQLNILEQLSSFELGRFLIQHQGLDGFWTDYVMNYPERNQQTGLSSDGTLLSQIEKQVLELPPLLKATRERYHTFLRLNQAQVKENKTLACIPCGMMGEFLYLDYAGIDNIQLIGIDYEDSVFDKAKQLAESKNLLSFCEFKQSDAWSLSDRNAFDLISSNGLNLYEPDEIKNKQLYETFYKALKPQGVLLTSFLTYPPSMNDASEWKLGEIKQESLLLQRIIFKDVIDAKFNCFTSSKEMSDMLNQIGFKEVTFHYDEAHIMPTVTAIK